MVEEELEALRIERRQFEKEAPARERLNGAVHVVLCPRGFEGWSGK